jgi:hypothetical protein
LKKKPSSKTARSDRPTSRKTRVKKQRRKPAVIRRTLSQINYDYWWREHRYWNDATTLSRDEQKAAMFYEAYRRCQTLRDTWLKGISGAKAMFDFGWQMFAATALNHLPKTWIQLPEWLRKSITMTQLPEMLPPVGYSVWPAKPVFYKENKQYKEKRELTPGELAELERYHERCRDLAAKIIVVPPKDGSPLQLLKQLQRFDSEGFLIIAIDNKSSHVFNYAIRSLQRRLKGRRSYRIADLYWQWPRDADAMQNVEESQSIQRAEWRAIGKRVKKGKGGGIILEEKIFNFQELCKGLESYDKTGTPSDLMKRLRLGTG